MSKLIIVRGASGSGKSTVAKKVRIISNPDTWHKLDPFPVLVGDIGKIFETDQFWINDRGKYNFSTALLPKAHQWNQLNVERAMFHEEKLIVVANTFIERWEVRLYLDLAYQYKYDVEMMRTPGPWDVDVLHKRNKHNVPLHVIQRQVDNYMPFTEETEWSDLTIFNEPIRSQEQ